MNNPRVSIVVAMDEKRGIGKTELGIGKLPWHIPDDLKRFKQLTTGHPIIMGRKTFDSIIALRGKPLPNRTNIVITRDPTFKIEGCVVVHSLEEALEKAKKIENKEIFIIGGGQIFEQAIPFADRIYLTLVEGKYEADTFFPNYPEFKKLVSQENGVSNRIKYKFLILDKP